MKSLNRVTLLGNVGKDPEMKATVGGTTVANFSLATTKGVKDGSGKWNDVTTWHNLVAFGRTAEIIRDYVSKGSKLYIEGELQTRSWDDKETGQKRYKTEIVIQEISLLSPKQDNSNKSYTRDNSGYGQYTQQASTKPDELNSPEITDDDIPF